MGWCRVVGALVAAVVIAGCGSDSVSTTRTIGLPSDDLAFIVNKYCRNSAAQPTPAADALGSGSLYSQKGADALEELADHVELVRQATVAIRAGDTSGAKDLIGRQGDLDRELSRLVKSRGWDDCT